MDVYRKKLEKAFPVVERHYRVCRNGIVKQLVAGKNYFAVDWNLFKIPYVECVRKYLEEKKGIVPKRTLLIAENDVIAEKAALLLMEMQQKYQMELELDDLFEDFDVYDDYEFWDEEDTDEDSADRRMLRVISLKQPETSDKNELNKYILRLTEVEAQSKVLFTGMTDNRDIGEKMEAIAVCPAEMQFIRISKEQMKEPWAQELLLELNCDLLELDEMQADYYEQVMRYLLKGEAYKPAAEFPVKMLVHKIRKRRGKNLREEDLAWYLDKSVENALKNHPQNQSLVAKDFPMLFESEKPPLRQLHEMTGMKSVKEMAREFAAVVQEEIQNKELGILHKNMIFLGNPGTGKTTCAKLLADVMADAGNTNARFVVATRKDLLGEYVGHTAPKVAAKFEEARDGILFVDEAGFFLNTNAGGYVQEAVKEFVRYMEIYPDVTVIFAMYAKEARDFLELDPGLSSRISRFVNFEDYSDEELGQIARDMLRQKGYTLEEEADGVIKDCMEKLRKEKKRSFGNAREVRKLVESSIVVACVQKYGVRPGEKSGEKHSEKSGVPTEAAGKSKENRITAQNVLDGWRRLQQETVKKQESFGFGNRQTEGKMLCYGQ